MSCTVDYLTLLDMCIDIDIIFNDVFTLRCCI